MRACTSCASSRKSPKPPRCCATPRAKPERVIDGDAWWVERRLVARKLLDLGDAQGAYAICAQHSAHGVNARVEAEFHAGWIALRFSTTSPAPSDISNFWRKSRKRQPKKSRAAYWLARTAETRHTPEERRQTPTTITPKRRRIRPRFTAVGASEARFHRFALAPAPTPAQGDARDNSVRVVELLFASGEKDIGRPTRRRGREASDRRIASRRAGRGGRAKPVTPGFLSPSQARLASRRRARRSRLPGLWRAALHEPSGFGVAIDRLRHRAAGKRLRSARDFQRPRDGLMQMIESTARQTAVHVGVGFDPAECWTNRL